MLILGLESSCDETAAAVVRDGHAVLSNVIASQAMLHAEYGGVVPEIASRAHVQLITPVVEQAINKAGLTLDRIDAVAVANRPGLIGALLVSTAAAKAFSWALGVPIVGVDHVLAHLYAPLLTPSGARDEAIPPADGHVFPALGLVVSGGHTALYAAASPLDIRRLGSTLDDAIGEAYDKAAAILGLGYPGGPIIDTRAQSGDQAAHTLPVSRLAKSSLDFSYSGLKTALLYAVRGTPTGTNPESGKPVYDRSASDLTEGQLDDFCASFQRAAIAAIILKLTRAYDRWYELSPAGRHAPPRSLLVGGGVAANSLLRTELAVWCDEHGLALRVPPTDLCLDNAAMTAGLAHRLYEAGAKDDLTLAASPSSAPSQRDALRP